MNAKIVVLTVCPAGKEPSIVQGTPISGADIIGMLDPTNFRVGTSYPI